MSTKKTIVDVNKDVSSDFLFCVHLHFRLFERIPAVPGTSNNQGLTVFFQEYHLSVKQIGSRSGPTFCQA